MTKSPRSVYVIVRLDFHGNDVSNESIDDAIANMDYSFHYDDDYLRLIDSEIIETLYKYKDN